jgi:bifunctional DNase/RNase
VCRIALGALGPIEGIIYLLLEEVVGKCILSIWVGVIDADRLAVQLANVSPLHPLAYGLMARVLQTGS